MATVHTAHGEGKIIESETVRGRTQYKVAGDGFSVWLDETQVHEASEHEAAPNFDFEPSDHTWDNHTTLPYNPEPQFPVDMFRHEQTISPDHKIDIKERLRPSDSRSFETRDDEHEYPGPDPKLFAKGASFGDFRDEIPGHHHELHDTGPHTPQSQEWVDTGGPLEGYHGEDGPDDFHDSHRPGWEETPHDEYGFPSHEGRMHEDPMHPQYGTGSPALVHPAELEYDEPGNPDSVATLRRQEGTDYHPGEGRHFRPAGLDARYADIISEADHYNDPVQRFKDDPHTAIHRHGNIDISAGLDRETGEWMNLVEADKQIRTAAWKDVAQKASRLKREGAVHVKAMDPSAIYANVDGDNGNYEVMILRGSSYSGVSPVKKQAIADWKCSCPWGQWAFKRKLTFVGRLCSHGYATYLTQQSHYMTDKAKRRKKSSRTAGADAFKSWCDKENGGHVDLNAADNYLSTKEEPVTKEEAQSVLDYVQTHHSEHPERDYDQDEYSNDPEDAYKGNNLHEADVLRHQPGKLTPHLYVVPEGEEEHFTDLGDDRKTTGPDQIMARVAKGEDIHDHHPDFAWHSPDESDFPEQGIVHFSQRKLALIYTADEDLLNKIRDLSQEQPSEHFQDCQKHNRELSEAVEEAIDRGYAAAPMVAMKRQAWWRIAGPDDDQGMNDTSVGSGFAPGADISQAWHGLTGLFGGSEPLGSTAPGGAHGQPMALGADIAQGLHGPVQAADAVGGALAKGVGAIGNPGNDAWAAGGPGAPAPGAPAGGGDKSPVAQVDRVGPAGGSPAASVAKPPALSGEVTGMAPGAGTPFAQRDPASQKADAAMATLGKPAAPAVAAPAPMGVGPTGKTGSQHFAAMGPPTGGEDPHWSGTGPGPGASNTWGGGHGYAGAGAGLGQDWKASNETTHIPSGSYTVKPGDTASGIAERAGVPLSQLTGLGSNPDLITPGQQIGASRRFAHRYFYGIETPGLGIAGDATDKFKGGTEGKPTPAGSGFGLKDLTKGITAQKWARRYFFADDYDADSDVGTAGRDTPEEDKLRDSKPSTQSAPSKGPEVPNVAQDQPNPGPGNHPVGSDRDPNRGHEYPQVGPVSNFPKDQQNPQLGPQPVSQSPYSAPLPAPAPGVPPPPVGGQFGGGSGLGGLGGGGMGNVMSELGGLLGGGGLNSLLGGGGGGGFHLPSMGGGGGGGGGGRGFHGSAQHFAEHYWSQGDDHRWHDEHGLESGRGARFSELRANGWSQDSQGKWHKNAAGDFMGDGGGDWADYAFAGSGPDRQEWSSTSEDYVDEHERPHHHDKWMTDDSGDIIDYDKGRPQQRPKQSSRHQAGALEEPHKVVLSDESGQPVQTKDFPDGHSAIITLQGNGYNHEGNGHWSHPLGKSADIPQWHPKQAQRFAQQYFQADMGGSGDAGYGASPVHTHGGGFVHTEGSGMAGGHGVMHAESSGGSAPTMGELHNAGLIQADQLPNTGYFNPNNPGAPHPEEQPQSKGPNKRKNPGGLPKNPGGPASPEAAEAAGAGGIAAEAGPAIAEAAPLLLTTSREDESDVVRRFHASGGGCLGNDSGGFSDDAIASQAQKMLRTAGRHFTLAEQRELEDEWHPRGARNLKDLDLSGTHYEDE